MNGTEIKGSIRGPRGPKNKLFKETLQEFRLIVISIIWRIAASTVFSKEGSEEEKIKDHQFFQTLFTANISALMIKADNAINIHETFSPVHIKSKMHRIRKQMGCVSLGNGKFLILTPLWRILHCESSRAGIKRSNLSTTLEETQNQHIRCFQVFE